MLGFHNALVGDIKKQCFTHNLQIFQTSYFRRDVFKIIISHVKSSKSVCTPKKIKSNKVFAMLISNNECSESL